MSIDEKEKKEGTGLNFEDLDIFTNPGYMQPGTVLTDESSYPASTSELIGSYDVDDSGNLWALVSTKLIRVSNGNNANPGDFASYATSLTTRSSCTWQWGAWHGLGNPISTAYFYYAGGTNTLYRVGDLVASGTTESSVGTLDGMDANTIQVPFKRVDGELYIGHGQYIAAVDDAGTFTQHAFTLPNNWHCVGFAPIGDQLAILAKFKSELSTRTFSECRVFMWDKTATTGADDTFIIPTGGACAIANHNEVLRVFTATAGRMRIWEVSTYPVVTHELDIFDPTTNSFSESTNTGDFMISPTSLFVRNGILYFGVCGPENTNRSGLYALGKAGAGKPLALVLAKRFTVDRSPSASSALGHTPAGAFGFGTNIYCSYMRRYSTSVDGGAVAVALRCEEANSPTRSSYAIYESVLVDGNNQETLKDWEGFLLGVRNMPSSTSIRVDARVDNNSSHTQSVTSITRSSNTATVTTPSAHNVLEGDLITISGAGESQYNGIFTVKSAPTTTTFTYELFSGTPTSPATGTILLTHSYNPNSLYVLSSSNDQQATGTTADRFFDRRWTGVAGRQIQTRIRFTSSGTSCAQLYYAGLLSRDRQVR